MTNPNLDDDEIDNWTDIPQRIAKIGVGCVTGWAVGYIGMKVGKVASFTAGYCLIGGMLVSHERYVKIKRRRLTEVQNILRQQLFNGSKLAEIQTKFRDGRGGQILLWTHRDDFLTGGFTAGFLMGIGSA